MVDGDRSRAASWGWGILLVVASLIVLNGISWIFFGPDTVVSDTSENIGLSVTQFEEAYAAALDGTWVLVAIPVALVAGGLAAGFGVGGFLALMLLLALIALIGQLLAGKQFGHAGSGFVQPPTD